MPSTRDDSSGTPAVSSPGYLPLVSPGLSALIAESDAAVDRWLASMDWDAHDATLADLAAQADAAAHHYALLMQQEAEHAAGTVPAATEGPGDSTT